jgi:hypothetical protein
VQWAKENRVVHGCSLTAICRSPYLTEHINRFGDNTLNLGRKPPQPDYGCTIERFTSIA